VYSHRDRSCCTNLVYLPKCRFGRNHGKFILGVVLTLLVLILGGLGFAMLASSPLPQMLPRLSSNSDSQCSPRRIDGASCCSRDKSCTPHGSESYRRHEDLHHELRSFATADSNRQPASLATALYPPAPNLISDPPDDPEWHIFYAIRTGIRYAGMPAWEKTLSQQDIWKVTALLSHLNKLPPAVQEYWKTSFGVAPPSGDEKKTARE